jgi:hypothetical protein
MEDKKSFILSKLASLHERLFKDPIVSKNYNLAKLVVNENSCMKYDKINDILIECGVLDTIQLTLDKKFEAGTNLLQDIEFFDINHNNTSQKGTSVIENIQRTMLQGSKYVTKLIYTNPICCDEMLKARISTLETIETNYNKNSKEVDKHLDVMAKNEGVMAWIFEEKEDNLKELYDVVFFRVKALNCLNNSPTGLTTYNLYRMIFSPVFGIVSPIIYFIIPYIILSYKFKLKISFISYIKIIFNSILSSDITIFGKSQVFKYIRIISYLLSTVFYLQGIFSSIDLAKTIHKISKLLIGNLHGIIEYANSTKEVLKYLISDDINTIKCFFSTQNFVDNNLENEVIKKLNNEDSSFSIFKNFGTQLKTYRQLDINILKQVLQKSYILDSLLGAIKYKKENDYNYPIVVDNYNNRPILEISNMVHPSILKNKAVKNSIKLGRNYKEQNIIITSPNSSGKSILIKSIIINVLMCQTMGISCASQTIMTPFRYINTQINVPDVTGHESLFEAEMHRCKNNLDKLKALREKENSENKYSLIVMDEIFNSTNPLEAVAGAYAVCKKMSEYQTNLLIFTTHYNYLTKLAKLPQGLFANYRMGTYVDNENIIFDYKFEKGVNKHLLALELLKKSGFDSDIIKDAIEIKNMLKQPRK